MPIGVTPGVGSPIQPSKLERPNIIDQPESVPVDNLYHQSQRSICAYGNMGTPGPEAVICQVEGFRVQKQTEIYRVDFTVGYPETASVDDDFGIYIGDNLYFTPVIAKAQTVPTQGTLFLAPNNETIAIKSKLGGNGTYAGSLIVTRMLQGYRAG